MRGEVEDISLGGIADQGQEFLGAEKNRNIGNTGGGGGGGGWWRHQHCLWVTYAGAVCAVGATWAQTAHVRWQRPAQLSVCDGMGSECGRTSPTCGSWSKRRPVLMSV